MKKLLPLFLLLSGCNAYYGSPDYPYCPLAGYGNTGPCCKQMVSRDDRIDLIDCNDGVKEILNATDIVIPDNGSNNE